MFCLTAITKSVTQNIRGVLERLLRAAQRVLGSRMRLSELWLRTNGFIVTDVNGPSFRGTGVVSPSPLDKGYTISFVLQIFCDKK